MVAKTKTKTRTITKTIRTKAKGAFSAQKVQKMAVKAGLGVAVGLITTIVARRLAPDFADEAGIITASLAGGVPGTVVWTLAGRRLVAAAQGALGTQPLLGAGQQVGL